LDSWVQLLDGGHSPTPEEHCGACPELLEPFRQLMRRWEQLDRECEPAAADELCPVVSRIRHDWKEGFDPVPGYKLLRKLGKGGSGEVWEAERTLPNTKPSRVALKRVKITGPLGPRERDALEYVKEFRHPKLLAIHGSWQQGNHLIVAMELADGDLQGRLKKSPGGLPLRQLAAHMVDAALGIDILNSRDEPFGNKLPFLHRDIKPHNLMVVGDHVKVGDFGLLKPLEESEMQHSGAMTAAFAAPEWLLLEPKMSRRSDQYSLALTYYVLRTGRDVRKLWKSPQPHARLRIDPNLAALPVDEQKVVGKSLSRSPRGRYGSCVGFVNHLLACEAFRACAPRAEDEDYYPQALVSTRVGVPKRREPSPATGPMVKLVNVPPLPPHFLSRSADLEAVKLLLLSAERQVAVTGAARAVGLQGMGGIGKSVLAAALAQEPAIHQAFPDGIFWLTFGQQPQLRARQEQLCTALGDASPVFADAQQAQSRISQLTADKACLVILDDVWQAEHAASYGALGPRCRLLVTTRNASVAVNAAVHRLGVLNEEQGISLLARYAGMPPANLPGEAREALVECGFLPLAVAMIGALMRGKPADRWCNLLHKLQSADLEKIHFQFPDYPYPDLFRAIQVSFEALDAQVQARYLDFAVFTEDTPIPESVLHVFWKPEGLDDFASQDVLDALVEHSLVARDAAGRLSLHDLQYDFISKIAADRGDVAGLHRRLLDAYAELCPNGWPSGPDDGYYFQHVCRHLLHAGRVDDLRRLLLDYPWLAKLAAIGLTALCGDYELAAHDAELRLVQRVLWLSGHIISKDFRELPSQLLGRLLGHASGGIEQLLEAAAAPKPHPWLRPLVPNLTPPGGPLVKTLAGHTGWVLAAAVTPDGDCAISGSRDHTLKVWDLASGRDIRTLAGHSGIVKAVA